MRDYRAYGLHVYSAVPLPFDSFPQPPEASPEPDVRIRIGTVPPTLPAGPGRAVQGRVWQARPGAFLNQVEGVARCLVTDGKDILVEPLGGNADDVAAFFLNAAFAPLLQQRGLVTLQAAAVQWQAGAVLLLGPSAFGKSSLAAALVQRGHALLADDVTAVALDAGGNPLALPAHSQQRLWARTLDLMNLRQQAGAEVRRDLKKYWIRAERHCAEPQPVLAIFRLAFRNRPEIDVEPLSCGDAFCELSENTLRKQAADATGRAATHFCIVAEMARRVPMLRVTRPWQPFMPDELAARVDAHLRALPPASGQQSQAAHPESANPRRSPEMPPQPACSAWPPRASLAATQPGADAPAVVWLASYPKSGNTWLRAVLTNYLSEDGGPASINALLGGGEEAAGRRFFDEFLEMESTNMTEAEVERHLPQFRARLAQPPFEPPNPPNGPFFVKTHEPYRLAGGTARFPPTGRAVCLVRNPLDLAVSYAHHAGIPIDHAIAGMNGDEMKFMSLGSVFGRLPEPRGIWSENLSSWTEQADIPTHVARYEDLLADPHTGFAAIVRFIGLGEDPVRLRQAVEHSRFSRLQAQEAEFGFVEKQPKAQSFFRAGRAGSWRTALSPEQVRALVDKHGELMARFGYLREAQSFLGVGAGSLHAGRPRPSRSW